MQVKLFFILLLLLIINHILFPDVEIDSKLENDIFISRLLFKEENYSFCLIDGFDMGSSESFIDFSFQNHFINLGRVKRLGIWRELFDPMKVTANSDLYNENTELDNNNLFVNGGLYGLSLKLGEDTGINILFPDNLWIGGNFTRTLSLYTITAFTSASVYSNKLVEEWTSTYFVIPNTNPIHLGLRSILQLPHFTLDYLGSLSGSSIYKAGAYNRLFFELFGRTISLKGFGGIISPYFINTNLKLSDTKYLLSLYLWLRLSKNWEVAFKTNYKEDHKPVLPVAYIPTSGASSVKLVYDNSFFLFTTLLGQKFNFDSYGSESLENNINGKLGFSDKYSAFFYYDCTFNINKIIKRKFEIHLNANYKYTDFEFAIKLGEEIYEPVNENTLKFRVDQKLGTGDLFFKIIIREDFKIEDLSIGFSTYIFQDE